MDKNFIALAATALCLCIAGCHSDHDHKDHAHADKDQTAKTDKNSASEPHDHSSHKHEDHGGEKALVDYVCGMKVSDKRRVASFQEKPYYFCSDACKARFTKDPSGVLTVGFEQACSCKKDMAGCDCGHCSGKLEPCDCG